MAKKVIDISRIRGCLLGALAGDCLGRKFEGSTFNFTDKNDSEKYRQDVLNYVEECFSIVGPKERLKYTDDTAMARVVAATLVDKNYFDAKAMAKGFVETYFSEKCNRGYGGSISQVFKKLRDSDFDDVFLPAEFQFDAKGSYGNGGAMRVAPVALYFSNDLEAALHMSNPLQRTIAYAISLSGDTDTIATMAGAIAGALYGDVHIPDALYYAMEGSEFYSKIALKMHRFLQEMCESSIMLVNFDHMLIKEQCILLNLKNDNTAMMLTFSSSEDAQDFIKLLSNASKSEVVDSGLSRFDQRTEEASASSYFQVVLDVGAGSGILSFFAVQAEAKTVYAIEASSMAVHCETLTKSNGYEDRIKVIAEKVENAVLPELVDTIISEPMGCMLLNERMLESFVHARKFLKPGGKMYPTIGDLHFAPFSDEILYAETCAKANFWAQDHFHGINLSALKTQGFLEFFRQPIVDTFHCGILMAHGLKYTIDFSTCAEESFQRIEIPFDFEMKRTCFVHGMAFWFDVAFIGTNSTVWLSTSPSEPLTHWYQVRCQIMHPLFCKIDSHLTGTVIFVANKRQSYDIELTMSCDGKSTTNVLDLKYPFFRYNGQPVQPPPGNQNISPTDAYWSMVRQQPTTSEQHFAVNGNGAIVGVDVNDPQSMAQNAVNAWNADEVLVNLGHDIAQQISNAEKKLADSSSTDATWNSECVPEMFAENLLEKAENGLQFGSAILFARCTDESAPSSHAYPDSIDQLDGFLPGALQLLTKVCEEKKFDKEYLITTARYIEFEQSEKMSVHYNNSSCSPVDFNYLHVQILFDFGAYYFSLKQFDLARKYFTLLISDISRIKPDPLKHCYTKFGEIQGFCTALKLNCPGVVVVKRNEMDEILNQIPTEQTAAYFLDANATKGVSLAERYSVEERAATENVFTVYAQLHSANMLHLLANDVQLYCSNSELQFFDRPENVAIFCLVKLFKIFFLCLFLIEMHISFQGIEKVYWKQEIVAYHTEKRAE
ncbi:histone-arginine methyltransferase CARM1, partial [Trichinella spiralis]|uniref:histone-arginine methyltransferase CARM1 n=1 Tax=Trichinella spiralis TaxID=6334 RepID=UPI0001EFB4F0